MGNRLSKIYTRTGDDGTTGLADGSRIEKDNLRIHIIGDVDELNSLLGVLLSGNLSDDINGYLLNIQHRLFDIGAELSVPGKAVIRSDHVKKLEELIDTYNADLPPLKEFILPGGTMQGAICHFARAVCRRTERHMVEFSRNAYLNPETLIYFNRLSDLLFIFSRTINLEMGGKEVYWDKDRLKHTA